LHFLHVISTGFDALNLVLLIGYTGCSPPHNIFGYDIYKFCGTLETWGRMERNSLSYRYRYTLLYIQLFRL